MGTLKNNGLRASLALLVLIFGVFMVVKAMEKEEIPTRKYNSSTIMASTWHFTGTQSSEILQADKWQLGSSPNTNCVLDQNEPLPCQFTVNDAEIADEEELVEYFSTKYPTNTATNVRDNADSQKPEE